MSSSERTSSDEAESPDAQVASVQDTVNAALHEASQHVSHEDGTVDPQSQLIVFQLPSSGPMSAARAGFVMAMLNPEKSPAGVVYNSSIFPFESFVNKMCHTGDGYYVGVFDEWDEQIQGTLGLEWKREPQRRPNNEGWLAMRGYPLRRMTFKCKSDPNLKRWATQLMSKVDQNDPDCRQYSTKTLVSVQHRSASGAGLSSSPPTSHPAQTADTGGQLQQTPRPHPTRAEPLMPPYTPAATALTQPNNPDFAAIQAGAPHFTPNVVEQLLYESQHITTMLQFWKARLYQQQTALAEQGMFLGTNFTSDPSGRVRLEVVLMNPQQPSPSTARLQAMVQEFVQSCHEWENCANLYLQNRSALTSLAAQGLSTQSFASHPAFGQNGVAPPSSSDRTSAFSRPGVGGHSTQKRDS